MQALLLLGGKGVEPGTKEVGDRDEPPIKIRLGKEPGHLQLGCVDELFDDNPYGNKMYQSQKGLAQCLIPCSHTSKLFEIVEEPFDLLTELGEVFIRV